MKIIQIIITVCVLFATLYIPLYVIDIAQKQEEKYTQIKNEINKDIKENMSIVEIHNIVEINCQNIFNTDADIYNCIRVHEK